MIAGHESTAWPVSLSAPAYEVDDMVSLSATGYSSAAGDVR